MDDLMFVTLTGIGTKGYMKHLKVFDRVLLLKEHDNAYDSEAIRVEAPFVGKIGYIANSVSTKAKGTMSAGRLYDKFEEHCLGVILFVTAENAILKVELPSSVKVHEDIDKEKEKFQDLISNHGLKFRSIR